MSTPRELHVILDLEEERDLRMGEAVSTVSMCGLSIFIDPHCVQGHDWGPGKPLRLERSGLGGGMHSLLIEVEA